MEHKKFFRVIFGAISLPFLITVFTSCGTASVGFVGRRNEKDVLAEKKVKNDLSVGNVDSLIVDFLSCDEYRDTIMSYLCGSVDYESFQYKRLDGFCSASQQDLSLFHFFDSIRTDRENETVDYLSGLPISEIGAYYSQHNSEEPFLRPMMDGMISHLRGGDYLVVKDMRNAFANTDVYEAIDSVYWIQRDSLLPIVMNELNEYFAEEEDNIDWYRQKAEDMVSDILADKVIAIKEACEKKLDRGFFKKVFKHEKGDFQSMASFVNEKVEQTINVDSILRLVNNMMQDYVEESIETRMQLQETYLGSVQFAQTTYSAQPNRTMSKTLNVPNEDVKNITERKMCDAGIELGVFAASFLTSGAAAIVINVADLVFGVLNDKKEMRLNEQDLNSFSKKLYASLDNTFDKHICIAFDNLRSMNTTTANIFKENISQNF